jgi:tRNA pseudouridine13 synthase
MRRATEGLPGCGGGLKAVPEDFEVTELPAYEPTGEGEHLYLWVEKVGQDTARVAQALARAVGVNEREVGYAGLKDRQARTFQYFSVPARHEAGLDGFSMPGVSVLRKARHGNKLKNGHLKGNQFRVRIRDVRDVGAARAVAERLRETGCPNFFGDQRFGREDDNAGRGKRLLLGERLPGRLGRFERKLYLSAYQSLLFNRALDARMDAGTWAKALPGDVMKKSDSGGVFVCEAPAVDQARVDRFEVSPAGPLFGPEMVSALGEVAALEQGLLAEEGVSLELFSRGGGQTVGGRRAYRVGVPDLQIEADGADVLVSFTLPRGSYATVVLAELMKPGDPGFE